jgi:hypothetical protein
MAGITPEIAQEKLAEYLELESKIMNGQEARQGDRVLKHADLSEVREGITYWNGKCKELDAGDGSGDIVPKSVIPID